MISPRSPQNLQHVCHAIGERLKALAGARSAGGVSEEEFITKVLEIEATEVSPNGMTLVATNTLDDWTVFLIKIQGHNEACSGFEFSPITGQFRPIAGRCEICNSAL